MKVRFTNLELGLLLFNVFTLGAILVLMALSGPSVPMILLAVGAAGLAIGKLGQAYTRKKCGGE